ncbi:Gfo/Idh/MocA family oxidoreductase [Eubacteriales bacterium OttesenSCG-928-N13]|nr:Gfo/Idh/MocA family oxidoreductase [Eubacteriales bacterium OttesenSCG-928-N13]
MKEIGIGVIGWGFMGKTHTHALRDMCLFYPGMNFSPRLVSICSRRLEMAEQAKQQMGFVHATDDYRELLARQDVQLVSICTPNQEHERMALDAIAAGKHIYIDKPVAMDAAAAERIHRAAMDKGVLAQVALNNRFWPATIRAKQLVDEGRIGQILGFNARYLHSGSIDPNKPIGWKQGTQGGVLLDLGSHALDIITWLVGQPARVMCSLRQLYPERPGQDGQSVRDLGDDQALIMLRLPDGALGTVEASKIATGAEDELSFEVYGTKGALRFSMMEGDWLYFFDNAQKDVAYGGERGYQRIACVARYAAPGGSFLPPKNRIGWDRPHMHCYYSFLDCVANGGQPSPDLADGARLQRLMELCRASHEKQAWVDVR